METSVWVGTEEASIALPVNFVPEYQASEAQDSSHAATRRSQLSL